MVVSKSTVIARDSKNGNGKNLIIGGAFCYLTTEEYDRLMKNDKLDRIEVTDQVDTIAGTDIKTRSVIQFVEREETQEEKLDKMISLQKKAMEIDQGAFEILRQLGI